MNIKTAIIGSIAGVAIGATAYFMSGGEDSTPNDGLIVEGEYDVEQPDLDGPPKEIPGQPKDLPKKIFCHVIVDAPSIQIGKVLRPDLELVDIDWHPDYEPRKIPESRKDNSWYWSVVFEGENCEKIKNTEFYVGSSMREFADSSDSVKRRLLRTFVKCGTLNRSCKRMVPYGHETATEAKEFFVPVKVRGRKDLDFNTASK